MFSYPTPFTPPTTEDDKLSWLRLIRSHRVGATTFHRLLTEYGSAPAALQALPEIARAAGVAKYTACPEAVALAEMRAARKLGARMICKGDGDYPALLAEISDAPPLLWAIGEMACLKRPMVALVGARNASSLGTRMARKLAEGLAAA
ncbi:MAG: DNA-processing protein DprA, partial [Paracoccaceae bacterium]